MIFSYTLDGYGWATAKIEINNEKCELGPSYLTDALGDILNNLVYLIPPCSEDYKKDNFNFFWDEEGSIVNWNITSINKDTIHVLIKRFCGTPDDYKCEDDPTLIDTTCSLNEFIHELIKSCDLILKDHGFVGYKTMWNTAEFPISSYLTLKSYLINNNFKDLNFKNEIKILKDIM